MVRVAHTAPTETSTLSLHDALPIWEGRSSQRRERSVLDIGRQRPDSAASARAARAQGQTRTEPASGASSPGSPNATRARRRPQRSEEHTSELQSRENLVCRLLLEKK